MADQIDAQCIIGEFCSDCNHPAQSNPMPNIDSFARTNRGFPRRSHLALSLFPSNPCARFDRHAFALCDVHSLHNAIVRA